MATRQNPPHPRLAKNNLKKHVFSFWAIAGVLAFIYIPVSVYLIVL
jgi:hypothetical protein